MTSEDSALRREARFVYWPGDIVRLVSDEAHGLKAGDEGCVWGVYDTCPPLYEADFHRSNGRDVAMMFTAEQVELITANREVEGRIEP
jgi:hypothetical protein